MPELVVFAENNAIVVILVTALFYSTALFAAMCAFSSEKSRLVKELRSSSFQVQDLLEDLHNEEVESKAYLNALKRNGICTNCFTPYHHHMDEPFASCDCTQQEWYELDTPYMKLQKQLQHLSKSLGNE